MFLGPTPEVLRERDQVDLRRIDPLGADGAYTPPQATARQPPPEFGVDTVSCVRQNHPVLHASCQIVYFLQGEFPFGQPQRVFHRNTRPHTPFWTRGPFRG